MKDLKSAYKEGWIDSFNNQSHDKSSFSLDWEVSITKTTKTEPVILVSKIERLVEYYKKCEYFDVVMGLQKLIDDVKQ